MSGAATYHCAAAGKRSDGHCGSVFKHPKVDECPTVEGRCGHLMGAGWRPVVVRIEPTEIPKRGRPRPLQVYGAWIRPSCVAVLT